MKIGIFDSGIGGLIITKAIRDHLPEYDYVYLGDTKRVPYGGRSKETIEEYTKAGVRYLFDNGCALVIIACNTACADALKPMQLVFTPEFYPDRKVLGVMRPAVEQVINNKIKNVGIIATSATVSSNAYVREIHHFDSDVMIMQKETPLLVPLIEYDGLKYADEVLRDYLEVFKQGKCDALILGCTHYPILKDVVKEILPGVKIISQDDCVPDKVRDYLERHQEIDTKLSKKGTLELFLTEITPHHKHLAKQWFGDDSHIHVAEYGVE